MLHEKVRRSSKKEDGVSPTKSTSDPFHEWEVLIAKTAREEVSEEIPAGPTSPEDPEDQLNTEDLATEIQAPRMSAQDGYCFSCERATQMVRTAHRIRPGHFLYAALDP
eukprot:symbB.v1.2.026302.t1/scaffold2616.1/size74813/6